MAVARKSRAAEEDCAQEMDGTHTCLHVGGRSSRMLTTDLPVGGEDRDAASTHWKVTGPSRVGWRSDRCCTGGASVQSPGLEDRVQTQEDVLVSSARL